MRLPSISLNLDLKQDNAMSNELLELFRKTVVGLDLFYEINKNQFSTSQSGGHLVAMIPRISNMIGVYYCEQMQKKYLSECSDEMLLAEVKKRGLINLKVH